MECPNCQKRWDGEKVTPKILSCGHSVCKKCIESLMMMNVVLCPVCSKAQKFTIERDYNDSDTQYAEKCASSLLTNETLLSVISSLNKRNPYSYSVNDQCVQHQLPIHSYSKIPYSMLCDFCIEEVREYKLLIFPLPEAVENLRKIIKQGIASRRASISELTATISSASNMLELHSSKSTDCINELFEGYKCQLESIYGSTKALVHKEFEQKQRHTKAKLQEVEKKLLTFDKLREKTEKLCQMSDNEVVKYANDADKILKECSAPKNDDESFQESTPFKMNTHYYQKIEDFIDSSYRLVVEDVLEDKWRCTCGTFNFESQLSCMKCETFKEIPNLYDNSMSITDEELELLDLRRKHELNLVSKLDEHGESNNWYLINADWISQWKAFIFNKPQNISNLSENPKVGVLPPGPISNHLLFTDPDRPESLRNKLKPVMHYRGINQKVWEIYLKIYGGGPPIVRNKLYIYDK